mmetsp:Transcript_47846/g.120456  ORF Transcript_47846/g.120456 Transcript_47846/m.120456 type:complete len:135 (+) Transcript_47846:708-1112(+)
MYNSEMGLAFFDILLLVLCILWDTQLQAPFTKSDPSHACEPPPAPSPIPPPFHDPFCGFAAALLLERAAIHVKIPPTINKPVMLIPKNNDRASMRPDQWCTSLNTQRPATHTPPPPRHRRTPTCSTTEHCPLPG